MDVTTVCDRLENTDIILVYDIAKARIVLEVFNDSYDDDSYNLCEYDYSSSKPHIHCSKCTLTIGAEKLIATAYAEPTYWLWEGEPTAIVYAAPGKKLHMSRACAKCPTGAVEWTLLPRDFIFYVDLWCKICAKEIHKPIQGRWLSPDWSKW